jgi:threonine dehydratase
MQKTNKESGPALVGIELASRNDYDALLARMQQYQIDYSEINKDNNLFGYLI